MSKLALSAALLAGCADGVDGTQLERVAQAGELGALENKRVFFGHHSVGRDILDGVSLVAPEAHLFVSEAAVGENGQPSLKIADFEEIALGCDADIALMKLCFADFTPSTDVDTLFARYAVAVDRIHAARPELVVVHVTPALHTETRDPRSIVKRVLGRPVWGDQANARRALFAERMRERFADEPLFDLSRIESTTPSGDRVLTLMDGAAVPALWDGYSTDGGHLNNRGKRVAAAAFLDVLERAAELE